MPTLTPDTRPPPASSFGRIRIESVTTRLVLLTFFMFVLDRLLASQGVVFKDQLRPGVNISVMPLMGLAHFSAGFALLDMEIWRALTWPFVHASPWHVLVNIISLHCFGPVLESHYGSRRFLIFYGLCMLGGVAMYLLLWKTHYLMQNEWVPMFGASAPVLGVLVAACHVAPDATATIYDLVPIRLRNLALALLGLALFATFTWSRAAFEGQSGSVVTIGGAAAHLGGAAVAFLLIRTPQWVRVFDWRPFKKPPPF